MTPEEAAIRALLYICAAVLSAYGLLVLVASLWEFQYRQAAESKRQDRAVKRAVASGEAPAVRTDGITTDAVPGD